MERIRAEAETLAVLAAGEGFYPGPCPSCNGAPISRCPNCDGEGRIWAQGRAAQGGATLDDAGMIRLLAKATTRRWPSAEQDRSNIERLQLGYSRVRKALSLVRSIAIDLVAVGAAAIGASSI